jgi:phosphoglycolate phosphatase-like HAD superfamily hydrolase
MPINYPSVLALDFDGVLCDGLQEYFLTAWQVYCDIWQSDQMPTIEVREAFYRLRPVILTGWEMPLLVRAIAQKIPEPEILQNWSTIAQTLLQQEQLGTAKLAAALDQTRDRWIATDLKDWLSNQKFYPGVVERVKAVLDSAIVVLIISTKERRFIEQLLQQAGIDLTQIQIFGKEQKRSKQAILREQIAASRADSVFWFVEDRVETLHEIRQQIDLADVKLFLADWGYNTLAQRNTISANSSIYQLSLTQFSQNFDTWL